MQTLFRNALIFAVAYVIFMVPSYLLPWLGSNSTVLNVAGAAVGHGASPLWWVHAWCLGMLVLLTWVRGDLIGKKYMPVFPFLAAVFDLTPGLNFIPFIPTVFHIVAIISGVKGAMQQPTTDSPAAGVRWRASHKAAGVAVILTIVATSGSIQFVISSRKSLLENSDGKVLTNKAAEKGDSVQPKKSTLSKNHTPPVTATNNAKLVPVTTVKPKISQETVPPRANRAHGSTVQYINLNE